MGGFLLARVGEPGTMTAGKQTTGIVQLGDLAAAISTVRIYRTDKPRPIAAKATWRPHNREPRRHIIPAATVRVIPVFQVDAMPSGLDIDRRHSLGILPPNP